MVNVENRILCPNDRDIQERKSKCMHTDHGYRDFQWELRHLVRSVAHLKKKNTTVRDLKKRLSAMLLPCLWLSCPTCFHLYEASGNLIPEALTSVSLETKQWGQQKNIHLHTEKSKKRNSISVLEGLLSHLWTWDYQTMPRLKDMKGVWSFIERSISLSGSLHACLKQIPSRYIQRI